MPLGDWLGEGRKLRLRNWDVKGNEIIHILIYGKLFGVGGGFSLELQEHLCWNKLSCTEEPEWVWKSE